MRLIRKKEVISKTGLSSTSLYRLIAKGQFPRQVRLGKTSVCWVEDEVDAFIEERLRLRDLEVRL